MKRVPSNRMPKYVQPSGNLLGYLILVLFVSGLGYAAWTVPWHFSVIVIAVLVTFGIEHLKQKRIAEERGDESICTFARSFDYRSVDTWIIRATYEAIRMEVKYPPLKTDTFAFLGLDEGLDEIAEEVAQRSGRPLTNCEQNPWYGKVETVADMVDFFLCQPKQEASATSL